MHHRTAIPSLSCDEPGPPRRSGNGGGSGIGLQRSRIGESGTVVADFGAHARTGRVAQAGEAGDDRVIRVGLEQLGSRPPTSLTLAHAVFRAANSARVCLPWRPRPEAPELWQGEGAPRDCTGAAPVLSGI